MIVVASHNNPTLLVSIVYQLNNLNLNNHQVLVVDTNSDNTEFQSKFEEIKNYNKHFKFVRLNYTCWDSGAYIYGYNNFPSDSYIFLQDSINITDYNFFPTVDNFLKIYDVVPLIDFPFMYDNNEQKVWAEENLDSNNLPPHAIFGPIFGVNKQALDKIPKEWMKYPTNKNEGCGMERRWSIMFHQINCSKHYLELTNFKRNNTIYTNKRYIDKLFFYRK